MGLRSTGALLLAAFLACVALLAIATSVNGMLKALHTSILLFYQLKGARNVLFSTRF